MELKVHQNELYYELKQLYEKYQNLKITLTGYQDVFQVLINSALLNKALSSGQISTIEYFMEINYYTAAFNNYMETEKEYYEVIVELFKYQL